MTESATRAFLRFFVSLSLAAPAVGAQVQGDARHPVPDEAAVKQSEKLVRDLFKADFARKTPSERLGLARKLLKQGNETKDDPPTQYVLFREARDLAVGAGDIEVSFQAIEGMASAFQVDGIILKTSALSTIAQVPRPADQLRPLVNGYLGLAEEAIRGDVYDAALKAIDQAATLSRKAKEMGLATRVDAMKKEAIAIKAKYESAKKALAGLAASPEDPVLNHTAGSFLCLAKGDWKTGLPLLAKGPDGALRSAALRDLAQPADPAEQSKAADDWWDLGEKESGLVKDTLRKRAEFWYTQAMEKMTGLQKLKTYNRLAAGRMEKISRGEWRDVSDPSMFGQKGKTGEPIELPATAKTRELAPLKMPAGEYDAFSIRMKFDAERKGIGYVFLNQATRFWIYSDKSGVAGREYVTASSSESFSKNLLALDTYIVTVFIESGEWTAFVDGLEVGRVKTSGNSVKSLTLEAIGGPVGFDQVRLRKKE